MANRQGPASTEDGVKDYNLMVELIVREHDVPSFEEAVFTFVRKGSFRRLDRLYDRKKLVFALKGIEPFKYKPSEEDGGSSLKENRLGVSESELLRRYVHVWKTPDFTNLDLARIMRLSADDDDYMRIDQYVRDEIQDFVVPVGYPLDPDAASAPGKYVLRAKRRFESAALGKYLFRIGALFPALKKEKVLTLGLFQNTTGPLNTVSEFWKTESPMPDAHDLMKAALNGGDAPGFHSMVDFYKGAQVRDVLREVYQPYIPQRVLDEQDRAIERIEAQVKEEESEVEAP